MNAYKAYTGNEPAGTIIVRVVGSEQGPRAFIRAVEVPSDIADQSVEQSEVMGVQEALALATNKSANIEGGSRVVVEIAPDAEWDQRWGHLEPA